MSDGFRTEVAGLAEVSVVLLRGLRELGGCRLRDEQRLVQAAQRPTQKRQQKRQTQACVSTTQGVVFGLDGVCLLEELPLARHSLRQRGLLLLLLLPHVLAALDPRVRLPALALFAATLGVRRPRGEMAGAERCWTYTD